MSPNIEQFQEKRSLVTITRDIEGVENLHGFVLGVSKQLVLMHEVSEFHLDGYCIMNFGDIEKIRFSKLERYRAAILKAEKVIRQVGLDDEIELSDWESALRSLKKVGRNVIAEGERPEVDEFVIGRIHRVNKKSVTMQGFDAMGQWEADTHRLAYGDITSVTFDNEYVTVFSKYLRDTG